MTYRDAPYYPIIYVRGFAMNLEAVDLAVSDPYTGFNEGSVSFRKSVNADDPPKHVFESPVIRLSKEFGYTDTYSNGVDLIAKKRSSSLPVRSLIIYPYYDDSAPIFGGESIAAIEDLAKGLSELIADVKDLITRDPENQMTDEDFRCYLVAHSMGGLICRAFLQNPALDENNTSRYVDKVFTYGTPHNGIDLKVFRNLLYIRFRRILNVDVSGWHQTSNFHRARMAEYLDIKNLYDKQDKRLGRRVNWLTRFPADRFFCLIGTNYRDYHVAAGISRFLAGNESDGLVRIENASLFGVDNNMEFGQITQCPENRIYKTHSGPLGLVNSMEGYEQLIRFLFGSLRLDISANWRRPGGAMGRTDFTPPSGGGQGGSPPGSWHGGNFPPGDFDALYPIEFSARSLGKLWEFTRLSTDQGSAAYVNSEDLVEGLDRSYLATIFLRNELDAIENGNTFSLGLSFGIRAPDYETEDGLWLDDHYEGWYLFQDQVELQIQWPEQENSIGFINYRWQSSGRTGQTPLYGRDMQSVDLPIEGQEAGNPAQGLHIIISKWNEEAASPGLSGLAERDVYDNPSPGSAPGARQRDTEEEQGTMEMAV